MSDWGTPESEVVGRRGVTLCSCVCHAGMSEWGTPEWEVVGGRGVGSLFLRMSRRYVGVGYAGIGVLGIGVLGIGVFGSGELPRSGCQPVLDG